MTAIVVPETTDAATLLAAHVADNSSAAGKLHIQVAESVPHCYVAPDGNDTTGDGRWDRPKASIATAIDAVSSSLGSGRVILSPGLHQPTASIHVNATYTYNGLIVEGSSRWSTIVRPTGAWDTFWFEGNGGHPHAGMTFRDFMIDGRSDGVTRSATSGFRMKYAAETMFQNVRVENCNGPGWYSDSGGSCNYIEFYHCKARFNSDSGIKFTNGTVGNNILVSGGFFGNNDTYGIETQVAGGNFYGAELANNSLFGMRISGLGNLLNGVRIENNCVGGNPTTWTGTTAYVAGQRVHALAESTFAASDSFMCTVGGTTSGTEPTWASTCPNMADTVTDGTVTWMNTGNQGNSSIGAGIDDTGANRLHVVALDVLYQWPLFRGNTIFEFPESDLGGTWTRLNSAGAGTSPHTRPGLRYYGSTDGNTIILARDDRLTDVGITMTMKGAGTFNMPATNRVGTSSTSPRLISGAGSPEAAVTARIGSIYMRTDGGANTSVYVKESGTGNVGWTPK